MRSLEHPADLIWLMPQIGRDLASVGGNDSWRHSGLEDPTACELGSGAQVLGPITVGHGARVGANAVVTKDVECCVTVVGIPAREVSKVVAEESFEPYGTPMGDLPDPVIRAIDGLMGELTRLQGRVDELESRLAGRDEASLAPGRLEEGAEHGDRPPEPGCG